MFLVVIWLELHIWQHVPVGTIAISIITRISKIQDGLTFWYRLTQAVKRVLLRCCMIYRRSAYVGVWRFPRRTRVVYAVNVVGVCLRLRHRRVDADPHCAVEHLTTRFPPVSCSWRFPFPSVHPLFLLVVSSSSATPIFFHLLAIIFVVCSVLFWVLDLDLVFVLSKCLLCWLQ